jgi:pimeloyl-ACP methyl ester carboxylesterase
MGSNDKLVQANGVELCVEGFGAPADPAILLVMGAAASMLSWEDEFCERLAGSRFAIRYDHRDTGRSVSYEPGAPPTRSAIWSRMRLACSTPSAWIEPTSLVCRWAGRSRKSWRSTIRIGLHR